MITSPEFFTAPILIVDDQDANVLLLEEMLRGARYVGITSTKNPHGVCALHRLNSYSLIILDLQMPELIAFQVMEGLGAIETSGYQPVLVQTDQPAQKFHTIQNGAGNFVTKSFGKSKQCRGRRTAREALGYRKTAHQHSPAHQKATGNLMRGVTSPCRTDATRFDVWHHSHLYPDSGKFITKGQKPVPDEQQIRHFEYICASKYDRIEPTGQQSA